MPKGRKKHSQVSDEPIDVVGFKEEDEKEKVVELLMQKIPGLFDRFPQGSISRDGLKKLVDEIYAI